MSKKFFLIFLFLMPSHIFAHTLLLNVYDNGDNTINVEGIFSTGELASGAEVRLESINNGEILFKKRLPSESELTIAIPKEPYKVILNGGPRHQMEKEGIAPIEGFSKESLSEKKINQSSVVLKKDKSSSKTIILLGLILAFILLFLSIVISIRNTNKLMKELKQKSN